MRKKIEDIKLNNQELKIFNYGLQYTLIKKNNIYKLYSIHYGKHNNDCPTRSFYVITKNDIIIYWTLSSIFRPASDAWRVITEVYHGYGEGTRSSSWTWKSIDDFDCVDNSFNQGKDFVMKYLYDNFTEYLKKKWDETSLIYIDKRICTVEEIKEEIKTICYHL